MPTARALDDRRARPLAALAALAIPAALGMTLALSGCGSGRDGAAGPATTPPPSPGPPVAGETAPADTMLEPPPQGTPLPPATPPATPGRPRPGYDGRADRIPGVNATALRGRRIVLDPGHGGRFPGSIGVRGLTESEVNLGVALHLWGMLAEAGADVYLTRTTEADFEIGADSSLRADLQARTERANAWRPEVFLSIHHNADPGRRNNVNELQTYYRFDDEVASRELAESIHRRLKQNLGIEADRVLPGNFYVIRNSTAPAVLGEASYLTNPDVEARLALGAKQRLEAEGYFLGLVDYFARGVPRLLATRLDPPPGVPAAAADAIERPWIVLEADRPLDAAELVLDGTPIAAGDVVIARTAAGGGMARFRPATPLADGRHTVAWTARAAGGAWSRTERDTFDVELPVARVTFESDPPRDVAPGQVVALILRALDRHGRPVADTLRATFASRVGAVLTPDTLARRAAAPGEARAYARVTGGGVAGLTARIAPGGPVPAPLTSQDLTLQLAAVGAPARWTTGFARALDGAPVGGAEVSWDSVRAVTNPEGFFALPALATGAGAGAGAPAGLSCRARGYVSAADPTAYRLAAIGGGALLGKRIALDPTGGGADTTGIVLTQAELEAEDTTAARAAAARAAAGAAVDTTRALVLDDSLAVDSTLAPGDSLARRRAQVIEADANLRVARALREYLEAAGATVLLTRDAPESLTAVDRLRRTEAFRPDRVLVISHRAAPGVAGAGHYFSSSGGRALAGRIAARLRGRGVVPRSGVSESASYVVAQTAAVAASVSLPNAAPLYVDATRGAGKLRDEAYAIYLALLEDFGSDPKAWQEVVATVARGDSATAAPAAGVPVSLDGRWTLFTDGTGRVRFDGLPASARLALAPAWVAGDPGSAGVPAGQAPVWVTTPLASEVRLTIAP
jgi:N-acetylmuramoyl-L-alanine amidase